MAIITALTNNFAHYELQESKDFPLVDEETLKIVHSPEYIKYMSDLDKRVRVENSAIPFSPALKARFSINNTDNAKISDTTFGQVISQLYIRVHI